MDASIISGLILLLFITAGRGRPNMGPRSAEEETNVDSMIRFLVKKLSSNDRQLQMMNRKFDKMSGNVKVHSRLLQHLKSELRGGYKGRKPRITGNYTGDLLPHYHMEKTIKKRFLHRAKRQAYSFFSPEILDTLNDGLNANETLLSITSEKTPPPPPPPPPPQEEQQIVEEKPQNVDEKPQSVDEKPQSVDAKPQNVDEIQTHAEEKQRNAEERHRIVEERHRNAEERHRNAEERHRNAQEIQTTTDGSSESTQSIVLSTTTPPINTLPELKPEPPIHIDRKVQNIRRQEIYYPDYLGPIIPVRATRPPPIAPYDQEEEYEESGHQAGHSWGMGHNINADPHAEHDEQDYGGMDDNHRSMNLRRQHYPQIFGRPRKSRISFNIPLMKGDNDYDMQDDMARFKNGDDNSDGGLSRKRRFQPMAIRANEPNVEYTPEINFPMEPTNPKNVEEDPLSDGAKAGNAGIVWISKDGRKDGDTGFEGKTDTHGTDEHGTLGGYADTDEHGRSQSYPGTDEQGTGRSYPGMEGTGPGYPDTDEHKTGHGYQGRDEHGIGRDYLSPEDHNPDHGYQSTNDYRPGGHGFQSPSDHRPGHGYQFTDEHGHGFAGLDEHNRGFPGLDGHGNGFPGLNGHGNGFPGLDGHGGGFPGLDEHGRGFPGTNEHGRGFPGGNEHGGGHIFQDEHGVHHLYHGIDEHGVPRLYPTGGDGIPYGNQIGDEYGTHLLPLETANGQNHLGGQTDPGLSYPDSELLPIPYDPDAFPNYPMNGDLHHVGGGGSEDEEKRGPEGSDESSDEDTHQQSSSESNALSRVSHMERSRLGDVRLLPTFNMDLHGRQHPSHSNSRTKNENSAQADSGESSENKGSNQDGNPNTDYRGQMDNHLLMFDQANPDDSTLLERIHAAAAANQRRSGRLRPQYDMNQRRDRYGAGAAFNIHRDRDNRYNLNRRGDDSDFERRVYNMNQGRSSSVSNPFGFDKNPTNFNYNRNYGRNDYDMNVGRNDYDLNYGQNDYDFNYGMSDYNQPGYDSGLDRFNPNRVDYDNADGYNFNPGRRDYDHPSSGRHNSHQRGYNMPTSMYDTGAGFNHFPDNRFNGLDSNHRNSGKKTRRGNSDELEDAFGTDGHSPNDSGEVTDEKKNATHQDSSERKNSPFFRY